MLFVHPYNHLMPQVIPVGSIGAVNLLPKRATGRYAHEVTRNDLEKARVILLDLHWFFALPAIEPMIAEYRRVAPQAKIVAGGLTASFYHEIIFDRIDFDYVLIGDVEVSFRTLMDHLLDNELPPSLANVCSQSERRPRQERASNRLFNELDWVTIDWFPTLHKEALALHSRRNERHRDWGHAYPLLPLRRGCARKCEFCYGAFQDEVFGEQVLHRSPERLVEDLSRIQALGLSFVTLFFGDAAHMGRYLKTLSGRRFSLDAFVFLCGVPDLTVLQGLRDTFDGRVVYSVIQPSDLRGLPRNDTLEGQSEALSELLGRVQSDQRDGAIVWHTSEPEPSAVMARERCSRVFTSSGVDWNATRPNAQRLGEQHDLKTQLIEVETAARHASVALLVRGSFQRSPFFPYWPLGRTMPSIRSTKGSGLTFRCG